MNSFLTNKYTLTKEMCAELEVPRLVGEKQFKEHMKLVPSAERT